MTPKFVLQDNFGNSGQYINLTQGESRTIKVFLRNADDTPFVFTSDVSTVVAEIYTSVSSGPIEKTLAGTDITLLTSTDPAGCQGFEFIIADTETNNMANNSGAGLPMSITVTTDDGIITTLNFPGAFVVDAPLVPS